LLIANENFYTKLTLGVTVIEFVDGKKHPRPSQSSTGSIHRPIASL
jgi:hypothetical protein